MSALDPELKRLFKWAGEAPASKPEWMPVGFHARVLDSRQPAQPPTLLEELQRTAWGLSCVALALILCGAIVLMSQSSAPPPTEELSSALNFIAGTLPR